MKDYQLTSDGLYAYRWLLNALPELAFDLKRLSRTEKCALHISRCGARVSGANIEHLMIRFYKTQNEYWEYNCTTDIIKLIEPKE